MATAAGVLTASGCGAFSADAKRSDSREFAYTAAKLVIEARGTPVRLEPGVAGKIRVERRLTGKAAEQGNAPLTLEGQKLHVGVVCSGIVINCGAEHTIQVPPGVTIEVDGDDKVNAVRLAQPVKITARDDNVHTDGMTGPLEIVTGGDIVARRTGSPQVTARSTDGHVSLAFSAAPTKVEAVSRDGAVDLTVPRTAGAYRVTTASDDGRATSEIPNDRKATRTLNARSGTGEVRVRWAGGAAGKE
ncbi:DUF4097 family beta strand repeat-containing protein [Sphaerisporangium fuscum]|uniref:DUF4097 family beta strand repeat-containing protein n=1 Tax=Sphaerisporangium fuscum TaxID=2835868 RepID=UPI001BDD620F|nr:DUF4097 family beta strand repeat-containing protein [Sphaerisporangium fuscum]